MCIEDHALPHTLNSEEQARNPRERPGYDLVFDDIFDGPDLNIAHWLPHYRIDTRNFHVYGVEWTAARLTFFVDTRLIQSIDQSPQYPLQFMLGIFELPFVGGWNGPLDAQAPYPTDFVIDYVRGYRRIGA